MGSGSLIAAGWLATATSGKQATAPSQREKFQRTTAGTGSKSPHSSLVILLAGAPLRSTPARRRAKGLCVAAMSVLLETSKGDIVIDLHCEDCPIACKNFLKLCKIKYYNFSLFHNVQPGSHIQTGDPTGTGQGGDSLNRLLYGDQARFFEDEFTRKLRHDKPGTVSMANTGPNTNASQFFITTTGGQDHLDDKYVVFGEVAEGLDIVQAIAEAYADADGRPYQNIRIRHTIVLDDPFDDPFDYPDTNDR